MRRAFFLLAILALSSRHVVADSIEVAPGVLQLGTIQNPEIVEGSGLIPSRRNRGWFWTHNDSGPDLLFAIAPDGSGTNSYHIKDADLQDWEDIALSGGRLYIADIGNNDADRKHVDVYAISEPKLKRSGELRPARRWTLDYPDKPFDAESLFISRGYGYIIQKEGGVAHTFRFKLRARGDVTLQEQCKLDIGSPAAGADLTPDGKRLAVITRDGAFLFTFQRKIPSEGTIEPTLFVPFSHEQMEGCCFTRDGLLVTSETREIYLFTDPQFQLRSGARVLSPQR